MHTVMVRYCTGCELCLPVCPVDCIMLENATGTITGWAAWSPSQAQLARERYELRATRRKRTQSEHAQSMEALADIKLENLAEHSRITDPEVLKKKKAVIEAAMARARAQRTLT
jgi:electron transport complex protein RnfB